jgi:hypothetical protein
MCGAEDMRSAYKILVGKPEGIKPLGRAKRTWKDNIRIDHREIWWEVMDWIRMDQNRNQ